MEFNLGDIIFFGAIAVAIISSIVKQLKRAKQSPQQPVPEELEDYYQNTEIKKEIPAQKKKKIVHQQPVVAEKQLEEFIFEDESPVENNDFNLDFSDISEVKKGIIYAEILNRKY